ncbi:MAG: hypothetical protein Q4G52_09555 [Clostridia bacterium]|nr:hypothetical protein [Clostridia bacterium]
MNKKLCGLLTALLVCANIFAASAEEHAHSWGAWTKVDGASQHTAACTDCGETKTVRCTSNTVTLGGDKQSVCAYCGANEYGAFERIEGAAATPLAENPSSQRGEFVAFGKAMPFEEADSSVLYAFTIGYELDGGVATFKNKSTVSLPIADLPEGFQLIRISTSSGDDSTSPKEEWVDIEYAYENGVLSFDTKNPALYIVKAEP